MSKIDFEYNVLGTINHAPVEGFGTGMMDTSSGQFDAEVTFSKMPMHWDGAFNFLMTDTTKPYFVREDGGVSLRSIESEGYIVNWRGAYLYDTNDRVVGHITASSVTTLSENKVVMRSEIHDSWLYLAPDETVIEIKTPYEAVVNPFGHVNLMTSGYRVLTDKDNEYWGWTTYPYITSSRRVVPATQRLTVDQVSLNQNKTAQGSTRVAYQRISHISPA